MPDVTADPVGADDWMYLQRANADGTIPAAAVNEAIAQSKAAGQASQGSPSHGSGVDRARPEQHRRPHPRHRRGSRRTQDVVYIATGSGGVWKSTDGGATFTSAWDNYLPQSIGAVAVDSHGVVWVGTGEVDHGGGSAYYGKGVYKSTDGGATWTNMGLEDGDTVGPDRHRPARRQPRLRRRPGCAARHEPDARPVHDRGRRGHAGHA